MTTFAFTITEYDPGEGWIILSTGRDRIEAPDVDAFYAHARERWPSPRFGVQLDQTGPTPFSQLRHG